MTAAADYVELMRLESEWIRQGRDDLYAFCQSVPIPGVPAEEDGPDENYTHMVQPAHHHRLLIDKLEAVERGDNKRLMVLMPPGCAKSSYCSVIFPTWYLGRKPNRSIICTSYGSNLPKKFGRRCRNLIRSPEYQRVMGVALSEDSQAADEWALVNGSDYMSGGILSGLTGNRTDGAILDDPIKGREDAESDTIREKTWEAYLSDLRTRIKPRTGFIVLILTRWHEDDPAGRILPEGYKGESGLITAKDGEVWDVLSCQAQCERADDPLGREIGEYIWPEWFPEGHLEQEKVTQGSRNWASLYQQRPAPETGSFFQREWFRHFDPGRLRFHGHRAYIIHDHLDLPQPLTLWGASDLAVTDEEDVGSKDAAYSTHIIAGVDHQNNLYILGLWRQKTDSLTWCRAWCDLIARWKPLEWLDSKGQIEKSVFPFLSRMMRERNISQTFDHMTESANKVVRAQPIRARLAQGMVLFPSGGLPWVSDLENELLAFPGGKYADQVDAIARFGLKLDSLHGASKAVVDEAVRFDSPVYIKDVIKQMANAADREDY